ncbi:hypothetical protein GR268_48565, partial [Rhizobium leguminosarum]|nr:hypothetical protein [Rhizobium leguminosarum]
TLPYTKDDLSAKYGLSAAREAGKKVVLISPSVYAKSFLTNRAFIDSLIKLQASEVAFTIHQLAHYVASACGIYVFYDNLC